MKEEPENFDKYLNLFIDVQLAILENNVPLLNRIKDNFDSNGNFFIDFEETQCTAYEEDLECNSNDAWDYLWDTIYNPSMNN